MINQRRHCVGVMQLRRVMYRTNGPQSNSVQGSNVHATKCYPTACELPLSKPKHGLDAVPSHSDHRGKANSD